MSKFIAQTVRGTRDIMPEEGLLKNFIENCFISDVELFGFKRIETPIFEYSAIFNKSLGDDSDIIQKEMYLLRHKEGDLDVALRPESTAGVVRAFYQNGLFNKSMPVRLYYIGPMFRHERPQKGRLRQFWQMGVESIGEASSSEDAIVILTADFFLRSLNIPKQAYSLEINSIGCPTCRKNYIKKLLKYLKKSKFVGCSDCQKRLETNPLRIFDCKQKGCQDGLKDAPAILDDLCSQCQHHFKEVLEYLEESNIPFNVNPHLVRGLDYYNRTVFEFIAQKTDIKGQAIIAGGRYDDLMKKIGRKDFPAVGYAFGYERLSTMYNQLGLASPEKETPVAYIIQLGEKAKFKSLSLMSQLAASGISVQASLSKDTLKSQLKAADKAKARYALILGQREILDNTVMLKNLKTGSQETVPVKKLIDKILEGEDERIS